MSGSIRPFRQVPGPFPSRPCTTSPTPLQYVGSRTGRLPCVHLSAALPTSQATLCRLPCLLQELPAPYTDARWPMHLSPLRGSCWGCSFPKTQPLPREPCVPNRDLQTPPWRRAALGWKCPAAAKRQFLSSGGRGSPAIFRVSASDPKVIKLRGNRTNQAFPPFPHRRNDGQGLRPRLSPPAPLLLPPGTKADHCDLGGDCKSLLCHLMERLTLDESLSLLRLHPHLNRGESGHSPQS